MWDYFPAGPGLGQGQDPVVVYIQRAESAAARYDDLLKRAANIGYDAGRNEILAWVSNSDVPGTPAERRKIVAEELANPGAAAGADTTLKRVADLEWVNQEFERRVKSAETAYATIQKPNPPGTISQDGPLTLVGFGLGAVGILSLLVVPLMVRSGR